MKPPGKTTLNRMQLAAQRERERIEISQDGRVATGMLKKPMPEQVSLRDDFAGIVRLIDSIQADAVLLQRVLRLMRSPAGVPSDAAPVLGAADE
jgi:hypothetical protein